MSIDMYLGDSQSQAASARTMSQEEIAAYQDLEGALTAFEGSMDCLKGEAYDTARDYSSQVLRPLVSGGEMLAEAVGQAVSRFPEAYVEQVSDESLRESDLMSDIQDLDQTISTFETLRDNLKPIPGDDGAGKSALRHHYQSVITTTSSARQILQDKLDKLRDFNASSPQIFAGIETLISLINTGLSQLGSGWDASRGVYVLPANLSWATTLGRLAPMKGPDDITLEERIFVSNLMEQYGFDEETALQILEIKRGIDEKFSERSQDVRDYLLNRVLGGAVYDGFNWDNTAGDLFNYFYKVHVGQGNMVFYEPMSILEIYQELGLTEDEAKNLYYEIKKQYDFSALDSGEVVSPDGERFEERLKFYKENHDVSGMTDAETEAAFRRDWADQNARYAGTIDFAHQSITTATHLNPSFTLAALWFGGEGVEEVAGWRGDATKDAEARPSMGNDDYRADLDAVNITSIMEEKGLSYMEAYNYYYSQLEDTPNPNTHQYTRSEQFLENVDLQHVKDELYDMVPKTAVPDGEDVRFEDKSEEEMREYLKEHYPDSYDFLRSLEERDHNLGNYAERE